MSGAPRVRSMNVADSEARPVLGPTGNTKAGPLTSARKPASKQLRKDGKSPEEVKLGEEKKVLTVPTVGNLSPKSLSGNFSSVLRRHEQLLHSNLSLNASCSSDASTDSFHSRASTGRLIRLNNVGTRRKQYVSKPRSVVSDGGLESLPSSDGSQSKKSCAWVTPNTGLGSLFWKFCFTYHLSSQHQNETYFGSAIVSAIRSAYMELHCKARHLYDIHSVNRDFYLESNLIKVGSITKLNLILLTGDPCYTTFHDEEWGLPVHDDRKLFELLVLSGALAELTWPAILSKRHMFREVFADFDPIAVSKFNEKKIIAPGSTAASLLSELKLRAIIENARQISKVIDEFGSFDKYIWSFVNYKPIVSRFRYPRQVPVKTPKADAISKDLVRRGFRSVGPTVIYSFMQVAGVTNDHLISCFRFQECIDAAEGKEENGITSEDVKTDDIRESKISIAIDELSFSSE
ncbi:hypothetical protein POTOM_025846 [Populus tomentosa]|uniref:DNA glycosylase superfamily protein n=1 Tax=Populus tomentosa TaxID=118781 RepID=A0A8X7ZHS9_POPTO|nr:hypothetical protein POTOM_025846 [Populus tomentosa]